MGEKPNARGAARGPHAGYRHRVVVSDLDGTLWSHDERVHPRSRRAIAELEAQGIRLLFATGRRLAAARRGLDPLGWAGNLVTMNGATGTDLRSGTEWHREAFSHAAAAATWDTFLEARLPPVVYVCDETTDVVFPPGCATSPAHRASFERAETHDPGPVLASGRVIGFALCGIEGSAWTRAQAVGARLAQRAAVHVGPDATYGGGWLAVGPPAATKRATVARWCAANGVAPADVVALGDGGNDLELLGWAGTSVAVRGSVCAQAGADHVIAPPSDGGWASVLDLL